MNSPAQIESYVREALRSFRSDPPDTDTQEAYLDAIVNFATEGLGIPVDDPDIAWVSEVTSPPEPPRQIKRTFKVIDGGRS